MPHKADGNPPETEKGKRPCSPNGSGGDEGAKPGWLRQTAAAAQRQRHRAAAARATSCGVVRWREAVMLAGSVEASGGGGSPRRWRRMESAAAGQRSGERRELLAARRWRRPQASVAMADRPRRFGRRRPMQRRSFGAKKAAAASESWRLAGACGNGGGDSPSGSGGDFQGGNGCSPCGVGACGGGSGRSWSLRWRRRLRPCGGGGAWRGGPERSRNGGSASLLWRRLGLPVMAAAAAPERWRRLPSDSDEGQQQWAGQAPAVAAETKICAHKTVAD